jgi:hypothetical protein
MYCQQCGAEVGGGRFCRKCGAPTSTDALSTVQHRAHDAPDYEKGFKKLFMGLAFLAIAIVPIFSRGGFWWWMLFPAVPLLAAGIGELTRARHSARALHAAPRSAILSAEPAQVSRAAYNELPRSRNTSELAPPASVTEGTTRHLNEETAPRE